MTRLSIIVVIATTSMALSGCVALAHLHNFKQDKRLGKIENRLDSIEGNTLPVPQEQTQ